MSTPVSARSDNKAKPLYLQAAACGCCYLFINLVSTLATVDRRVPALLQGDKVLWGECLSGALYKGDFVRILRRVGFTQHWVVTSRALSIG